MTALIDAGAFFARGRTLFGHRRPSIGAENVSVALSSYADALVRIGGVGGRHPRRPLSGGWSWGLLSIMGLAYWFGRRFAQMDERFARIDERFRQIDGRFEQVDRRLGGLEASLKAYMDEKFVP